MSDVLSRSQKKRSVYETACGRHGSFMHNVERTIYKNIVTDKLSVSKFKTLIHYFHLPYSSQFFCKFTVNISNTKLMMEEAIQKFSKYSVNVEHDLESLIFSMLNLIDTKTRTLKKLLKLHLQIRTIRKEAHSKYKKHFKSSDNISDYDLLLKDSVDDLTFSEDSHENVQNEINELKGISESFALSRNSSLTGIGKESFRTDVQQDENLEEVNDFANNIEQSDNENIPDVVDDEMYTKDRNGSLNELPKESFGELDKALLSKTLLPNS